MTDWQPIETAPKDGVFLVWLSEKHKVLGTRIGIMRNHPNGAFINGLFSYDMPKPTDWAPLPSGPK